MSLQRKYSYPYWIDATFVASVIGRKNALNSNVF